MLLHLGPKSDGSSCGCRPGWWRPWGCGRRRASSGMLWGPPLTKAEPQDLRQVPSPLSKVLLRVILVILTAGPVM